MRSAISRAISSTVESEVLRASLSASDGLFGMTSLFVMPCQSGSPPSQLPRAVTDNKVPVVPWNQKELAGDQEAIGE